jgi:hypothetical protein
VVVAAGMLVFSPLAATAARLADDPGPTDWPAVKELKSSGSGADPGPVDWPAPDEQ